MEEPKQKKQETPLNGAGPDKDSTQTERELLEEILHALRAIRYGSVNLTVHDGRIVEIQKTERIRKSPAKRG